MPKLKTRRSLEPHRKLSKSSSKALKSVLTPKDAIDPSLALLFSSSAGPVKPLDRNSNDIPRIADRGELLDSDTCLDLDNGVDSAPIGSNFQSNLDSRLKPIDADSSPQSLEPVKISSAIDACGIASKNFRKRKRGLNEDGLEEEYFLRITKDDEEEGKRRTKRHHELTAAQDPDSSAGDSGGESVASSEFDANEHTENTLDNPLHETLTSDRGTSELEKSSRTVFLGNVSIAAITDKKARKALLGHMVSFVDSISRLEGGKDKYKVESIRFRSTAYTGGGLPKKAAYVTKALMAATTKSTNAYIVYSTALAAKEAVKRLNGTIVLDRHLRVDSVAHPAKTDHRRCVFVGNLGFVDDESIVEEDEKNRRKNCKVPSDIEEGLWRQFGKVGTVESVRVVRDEKTRVGKGFAYVQFQDANSVEAALLLHGKPFPPMLPRVLRVTRAKAVRKTALASRRLKSSNHPLANRSGSRNEGDIYKPKMSAEQLSLQGRAPKLLGKVGATNLRRDGGLHGPKRFRKVRRSPENIVFEGLRASENSRNPEALKLRGKGKSGKPNKARSTRRVGDKKRSR